MNRGPSAPARIESAGRQADRRSLSWLEPSVRLSGLLSFSRKYLLIGVVVVLALGALSFPLVQGLRHELAVAERERLGLRAVLSATELLADLVRQRDVPQGGQSAVSGPAALDERLLALSQQPFTRRAGETAARQLTEAWQLARGLGAADSNPQRFAAYNAVVNPLLTLIQSSAQDHRLNVDPELDATVNALTVRLPQVLDMLGKHSTALAMGSAELAPFAFSAQVVLTEALPALAEATAQLRSVYPNARNLEPLLQALQTGIFAQLDAADKIVDRQPAGPELTALARANQARALELIRAKNLAADEYLKGRIDGLIRSQWVVGLLLVVALAAIAYLFAGIYVSTLRSLNRLSRGTADFCAGRLDARIRVETRDELVDVARNFNTMAEEFERLLGLIREQNESRERELSEQVRARTAELAETNAQLSAAAHRVQEELALARDMQRALLPQEFPGGDDWQVYGVMRPARELGGDFYDMLTLPDGRTGVLVADVSGKGVAAAFFMAVSRTVLLDLAATGRPPAEVLARANDLLCQRNPMQLFITVFYAIYDQASGRIEYASGGHPAPLVRRADGRVVELPSVFDVALAVMPDLDYVTLHDRLGPGEAMLMYTDGVTEAFEPNGEAFGNQRLQDWLARSRTDEDAQAMVGHLVAEVSAFVAGAEASDDLTCLILSRARGELAMPVPPSVPMTNKVLLLEYSLPTQLPEIERLADAVSAALPDRPDLAFSANLCLEELITNIITHGLKGRSDCIIRVRMSISVEWLEIILKDDAPPFDPFRSAPEPDLDLDLANRPIGGLGVHLVKALMDDARAYYDGSGNLIVLLKTVRQPAAAARPA
jgi:serine phosphatase RsbU (regulator of sigma subunit)/anti-sigma regulatory factor (Ser/Thr protein kinase)